MYSLGQVVNHSLNDLSKVAKFLRFLIFYIEIPILEPFPEIRDFFIPLIYLELGGSPGQSWTAVNQTIWLESYTGFELQRVDLFLSQGSVPL